MSNHPLGPWSLTLNNRVDNTRGYTSHNNAKTYSASDYTGEISTRTGYNSGGPSVTPRSASLDLHEYVRHQGFSCAALSPLAGGGFTTNIDFAVDMGTWNQRQLVGFPASNLVKQVVIDQAFQSMIKKQAAKFQSLAFLGESADTVRTMRNILKLVTGRHNNGYQLLIKDLFKLKGSSRKAVMRVVSDHWLEYQFGIVPLINDVKDFCRAIDDSNRVQEPVKGVTGRTSSTFQSAYKSTQNINGFSCQIVNETFDKIISKSGFSYRPQYVDSKGVAALLEHNLGLDLSSFLPSAYEVLPWSWLLDYFTNVSDFVNLAALQRGVSENGWRVTIQETVYVSTVTPTVYGTQTRLTGVHPGVYVERLFKFNRDPLNVDTYVPEFRFEVPSLRQAANVAAVATGLLVRPQKLRFKDGSLWRF